MNTQPQTIDNEIDLLDLLQTLWQKKLIIIAFAILGAIIGVAAALLLPQKWKSEAYLSAPKVRHAQDYVNKYRTLGQIIGAEKLSGDNPQEQIQAFTNKDINALFSEFLDNAASVDEKQTFLSQTDYFKQLSKDQNNVAKEATLKELISSLKVDAPDEKKKTLRPYYTLSFTADTATTAQSVLKDYVTYINQKTLDSAHEKLSDLVNSHIIWRQQELARIEFNQKTARETQIKTIEDALKKAKLADIKEFRDLKSSPQNGNGIIEINTANAPELYMQGERILTALLEATKQAEIIYPMGYHQLKYELAQLEPLQREFKQVQAYNYQLSPTLPTSRESPKRALIAIAATVLGGIIGVIYALLSTAFSRRRKTA